jgi:hypothetical protein
MAFFTSSSELGVVGFFTFSAWPACFFECGFFFLFCSLGDLIGIGTSGVLDWVLLVLLLVLSCVGAEYLLIDL